MVAASTAGTPQAPAAGGGGAVVPFHLASNLYVEKFQVNTVALTAAQQIQTFNIIPNGFLSNVRVELRSAGATAGTVTADSPGNLFANMELDNVDGSNFIYPMGGYTHLISNWMFRPWLGDPQRRYDYAQAINPSCSISLMPEIRGTAGVLANTDARSQPRVSYTLNTAANVVTGLVGTITTTVSLYLETWAQPDIKDLQGNSQEAVPPGLNLQTIKRRQVLTLNNAAAANTFQIANTGNELRGLLLIVRDSNNARQDYLSDPIRFRLDTRQMGVFSPNEVFNLMNDEYDQLQNGTSVRPTGVYMWRRFMDPGDLQGWSWLSTSNATYVIFESTTLATGANLPGTVEVVTDEVIPLGPIPMSLESI